MSAKQIDALYVKAYAIINQIYASVDESEETWCEEPVSDADRTPGRAAVEALKKLRSDIALSLSR